MAATFVTFTPSASQPFAFQAQLGAAQYAISVPWNIFGQRYYLQVADLSGTVLLYRPLIACGPQLTATFEWDADSATATATCASAHNVPLGRVADAYVSQTDSGFDGDCTVLATGSLTLTYALAVNPGEATPIAGIVNFNQNLIAPVISGAYLLFRSASQSFEFGPS